MKPPSYIKKAPSWIVDLAMAKDWSVPPWKIFGGGKLLWIIRYKVYGELDMKNRKR